MSPERGSMTTTEPALPAIARSAVSWMRRSTVVMTCAPGRGSSRCMSCTGRARAPPPQRLAPDALATVGSGECIGEEALEPGLTDHVAPPVPPALHLLVAHLTHIA